MFLIEYFKFKKSKLFVRIYSYIFYAIQRISETCAVKLIQTISDSIMVSHIHCTAMWDVVLYEYANEVDE